MDLSTKIAGIELKNPFMNGSGVLSSPKYLKEIEEFGFAAGVTKSATKEPQTGNAPPTIIDISPGITLNRVGLSNPGVDSLVKELSGYTYKIPIIGSAAGYLIEEYVYVAKVLESSLAVKLIEINPACPNINGDIACFDKEFLEKLLDKLDNELSKPYSVKLAPFTNFRELREIIRIIEKSKAQALVLTNTLPVRMDHQGIMYNWGQSGKSLLGLSLRNVYEASQCTDLDIIGCGGVGGPKDAIEYIRNGAKAIQMATILNQGLGEKIVKILENGILNYMIKNDYKSLEDFRESK